jgi:hypothetical protein
LENINATAIIKTAVMYDLSELKNHFSCRSIVKDDIESLLNSPCFYELIANSSNEFTLEGRGKEWAEIEILLVFHCVRSIVIINRSPFLN